MNRIWILTTAGILAFAAPAGAQQLPVIGDFLATIGGETLPNKKEKRWTIDTEPLRVLVNTPDEIIGHRFFREEFDKGTPNPRVTMDRALIAFLEECRAKGGWGLGDNDPNLDKFYAEKVEGLKPDYSNHPRRTARAAVELCVTQAQDILGGFAAIVSAEWRPWGYRKIWTIRTLVYAFRGSAITPIPKPVPPSPEELAARRKAEEARRAEVAENQARIEAFQRTVKIGTDTNCGTVIQVRGPMVEVALPAHKKTDSGHPTFWAKRERVYPAGAGVCHFGL